MMCAGNDVAVASENNSVCDNDALYAIMDYMCSPASLVAVHSAHSFEALLSSRPHRASANEQTPNH